MKEPPPPSARLAFLRILQPYHSSKLREERIADRSLSRYSTLKFSADPRLLQRRRIAGALFSSHLILDSSSLNSLVRAPVSISHEALRVRTVPEFARCVILIVSAALPVRAYRRNLLARGDSVRRHADEQMIPQDHRVKQNSSKVSDEREE